MNNYWLSEYSSPDDEEMPEEEPKDSTDPDDPEEKLNNN